MFALCTLGRKPVTYVTVTSYEEKLNESLSYRNKTLDYLIIHITQTGSLSYIKRNILNKITASNGVMCVT